MSEATKNFDTVSLHLAAALLALVPGATRGEVDNNKIVDGKRLLRVIYPVSADVDVKAHIAKYQRHELSVNLYDYNRELNAIRDAIKLASKVEKKIA